MDRGRRPRILLGITGSVAAVKGPRLALRLAHEAHADVKVVLTRTVERYFWKEGRAVATYDGESWRELQAATSATAANNEAEACDDGDWRSSRGSISVHYAEEEWDSYQSLQDPVLHIDLRNWADLCVIAPLSAHTLAKIANGLCDDLLTCIVRAWDFGQRKSSDGDGDGNQPGKPVILAPAMNTAMWDHPLTTWQLATVQKFSGAPWLSGDSKGKECRGENGVIVVEPAVKTLACGEVGAGALAELDDIMSVVKKCLAQLDKDVCAAKTVHYHDTDYTARKDSMKRALLRYAKKSFGDMKSCTTSELAAPISPTPNLIIETFLPRLNLSSESLLIDLGCGDGRWLIAAYERTQCRCLGVDVDEERLEIARESIAKRGIENAVQVRQHDVFQFVRESDDVCKADVIIIYLFREAMTRIGALLRQRRKDMPGRSVQILSVGFSLTGWTSTHAEKVNGIWVYLYSWSISE